MTRTTTLLAASLLLLATACGDAASDSTTSDTSASDTSASDTSATDTIAAAPAATDAPAPDDTATTSAFPVTIEHKYGETTIDAEPMRIVSVGFGEHDGLLALGVVPVAVRDWYGDQPFATWPWAQDELGDAEPVVLAADEENYEQIAALDPDLILGISSGMTQEQYDTLSAIAPTVAQPGDYIDYGTPWDVALEITGRAVGKEAEAAQVIADTEQLFADVAAEHPEFAGATAAVAFTWQGSPGAYGSGDVRSRALQELGFVVPTEIDDIAAGSFYASLSAEDLSAIDTDVIVWIGTTDEDYVGIRDIPTRSALTAFAEGREVVADPLLSAAFSHSSPLSLEYVVEELVPELALALDGDPTTAVPSAATITPEGAATGETSGDPAAEASAVWSLVFDSAVPFEEKAAHMEDAEALRATVEAYTAAGTAMGGISLAPTEVVVDGDTATVTYDVMFGETAAYTDQEGSIALVDGTWVVSRAEFCSFMASARNDCPVG